MSKERIRVAVSLGARRVCVCIILISVVPVDSTINVDKVAGGRRVFRSRCKTR